MPYETDWCICEQVVDLKVFGDITSDDLFSFNERLNAYLDSSRDYIHIVVDVSKVGEMPLKVLEIVELLTFMKRENLGWVVVCGASSFIHFVASVVFGITKARLRFIGSAQEALSFLHTVDHRITHFSA